MRIRTDSHRGTEAPVSRCEGSRAHTASEENLEEEGGSQVSRVIQLMFPASGPGSDQDGEFVVEYEPPSMDATGNYREDGRLITSPDIDQAKRFPGIAEAIEFTRRSNGLRPDGKPNRPLTGWHLAYVRAPELH